MVQSRPAFHRGCESEWDMPRCGGDTPGEGPMTDVVDARVYTAKSSRSLSSSRVDRPIELSLVGFWVGKYLY